MKNRQADCHIDNFIVTCASSVRRRKRVRPVQSQQGQGTRSRQRPARYTRGVGMGPRGASPRPRKNAGDRAPPVQEYWVGSGEPAAAGTRPASVCPPASADDHGRQQPVDFGGRRRCSCCTGAVGPAVSTEPMGLRRTSSPAPAAGGNALQEASANSAMTTILLVIVTTLLSLSRAICRPCPPQSL